MFGQRLQRMDRRPDSRRPLRLGVSRPPCPRGGTGAPGCVAVASRRRRPRCGVHRGARCRNSGDQQSRRGVDAALEQIPADSKAAAAVRLGAHWSARPMLWTSLHRRTPDMSPVHTLNNLALVVWALCSANGDFGTAIGDAVAAGWDTDCNGATVGGLFGLTGAPIPESWTRPLGRSHWPEPRGLHRAASR